MAQGKAERIWDSWWLSLIWGVIVAGGGVFLYGYLDAKERSGESFSLQWLFALIYEQVGKVGVLAVFWAIAAVIIVMALLGSGAVS